MCRNRIDASHDEKVKIGLISNSKKIFRFYKNLCRTFSSRDSIFENSCGVAIEKPTLGTFR